MSGFFFPNAQTIFDSLSIFLYGITSLLTTKEKEMSSKVVDGTVEEVMKGHLYAPKENELFHEPIEFDVVWCDQYCKYADAQKKPFVQMMGRSILTTEAILAKIREELLADFPEYLIISSDMDMSAGWIHVGDRIQMLVHGHHEGDILENIKISLIAEGAKVLFKAHAVLVRDDAIDCNA